MVLWPILATTFFGHDLLWPRRTLARPTLATAKQTSATTFKLANLGRFWSTDPPPSRLAPAGPPTGPPSLRTLGPLSQWSDTLSRWQSLHCEGSCPRQVVLGSSPTMTPEPQSTVHQWHAHGRLCPEFSVVPHCGAGPPGKLGPRCALLGQLGIAICRIWNRPLGVLLWRPGQHCTHT